MPVQVSDAGIRFPVGYSPWYVYEATIPIGQSFEFMDVLIANALGEFVSPATDADVGLIGGYCFALEAIVTTSIVQQTIQVAVPGSLVPFVAGSTLQPEELIKITTASGLQTANPAVGADFAAGEVVGRYRNQNTSAQALRLAEDQDIIYILSGLT